MGLYSYAYNPKKKECLCLGKRGKSDFIRLADLVEDRWRWDPIVIIHEGSRAESTLEDLELNGEVRDIDEKADEKEIVYPDARKRDIHKLKVDPVLEMVNYERTANH